MVAVIPFWCACCIWFMHFRAVKFVGFKSCHKIVYAKLCLNMHMNSGKNAARQNTACNTAAKTAVQHIKNNANNNYKAECL